MSQSSPSYPQLCIPLPVVCPTRKIPIVPTLVSPLLWKDPARRTVDGHVSRGDVDSDLCRLGLTLTVPFFDVYICKVTPLSYNRTSTDADGSSPTSSPASHSTVLFFSSRLDPHSRTKGPSTTKRDPSTLVDRETSRRRHDVENRSGI